MRIENKLTLEHLKHNRSRTAFTVIGIMVSTALITSIVVAVFSFMSTFNVWAVNNYGDYHFSVTTNIDDAKEKLEDNDDIESVGYELNISGKESGYKIHGVKNNSSAIGTIRAGDNEFFNKMIQCDYQGRFPESSKEIMIEKSIIQENDLDIEIGDYLTISTGERLTPNSVNSFLYLPIKGAYKNGELFREADYRQYKVVGILNNNHITADCGTKVLRGVDESELINVVAYAKFKSLDAFTYTKIDKIVDEFGFPKNERALYAGPNSVLLSSELVFETDNKTVYAVGATVVLLLLIVVLTAIFLVKNSFLMSLSEKIKYLGMLSSVGATKKQITISVLFESVILGAAGIISGFLFGAGVIAIIFRLLGKSLLESNLLEAAGIDKIYTTIPSVGIAIIFVLSMLAIALSAVAPVKKALEITPISAIRQSNEIKLNKRIRTPKLIRKAFGYEGELAHKNLRRNGRKSRIIVVSIIISVVMFICVNYFCTVYAQYTNLDYEIPYQVSVYYEVDEDYSREKQNEFESFLDSNPEIESYFSTNCTLFSYYSEIDNSSSNTYYDFSKVPKEKILTDKYKKLLDEDLIFTINFVDDDEFNQLCRKNNINPDDYYYDYDGTFKAVIMNSINHKADSTAVFTDEFIGTTVRSRDTQALLDEMGLSSQEESDDIFGISYIEFGDFVDYDKDNYLCNLNRPNTVSMYVPVSTYLNSLGEEDSFQYCYGIVTGEHKSATQAINRYFENNTSSENNYAFDDEYYRLESLAILTIVKVLMYFFITFISIITASNIVNTISSSISSRKREFAMLKSVGVTPKGFKKMIALESLFYGIKGLGLGIPLSVLICYLINKITSFNTIPFEINIYMYLSVITAVLVLVGATMLISVKKSKNDNIIEGLKTDVN
ncbi:MAG: ABC transporter permease [Eubacterium sp.]